MEKVMVEMSGGVDSSTTAAILLERGFDVCGVTMDFSGTGGKSKMVRDAKAVADHLRIPHYVLELSELFESAVIADFISEYKSGRTPNPCLMCNRRLKFGELFGTADELGCGYIATGHYAVMDGGELRRGVDPKKDQSYFLYPILAAPTDRILFPLGAMTKVETRALAKQLNLPTADKGESQDICFVPGTDYAKFLRSRGVGAGAVGGDIVDVDGNVIGKHGGIYRYTVGQRRGLGALGRPMYVKRIDPEANIVVAAEDKDLMSREAVVEGAVVSKKRGIDTGKPYAVQIRYKSGAVGCKVAGIENAGGGLTIRIEFDAPVRAVSPGQAAVIYDGDTVVAGGTIG